jgi:DNA polymerase-1
MQVPVRGQYAKLIKDMFVAREGKTFLEADYGQIEPRILAHSSGSISLCRLFREGADFHTFTADRLKIPRQTAKVLNLSVGYLASEYSVSDQLKCGLEEAKEQIEKWWALFPDLRMWIYQYLDKVRQSGYVTTLLGLKIPVEGLCDNNQYKRGAAERQAINNLCQGSAQEIMQLGMYELYKSGYHILLQIHDSVLLEEPTSHLNYLDIHSKLTDVYKLRVPLTISIKTGLAWGCMDKVEEKKYVSRV